MGHPSRNFGLVASAVLCGAFPAVGCSESDSTRRDGGSVTATADVRTETTAAVCPNGASPTDADFLGCPVTIPEGGSCCPVPGTACFYPGDNDTYRNLALCIDDPNHPPYWQQTLVVDRDVCDPATALIPLGATGAPACAERQNKPCAACNCAPADSVCAKRCGTSSGITTPQDELNLDLSQLTDSCGGLPNESSIQVIFVNGCATAVAASLPGPPGTFDDLIACIKQSLDRVHFECADSLECGGTGRSTLF
jgi:hypothetical protein